MYCYLKEMEIIESIIASKDKSYQTDNDISLIFLYNPRKVKEYLTNLLIKFQELYPHLSFNMTIKKKNKKSVLLSVINKYNLYNENKAKEFFCQTYLLNY